jgi:hypothetical protein
MLNPAWLLAKVMPQRKWLIIRRESGQGSGVSRVPVEVHAPRRRTEDRKRGFSREEAHETAKYAKYAKPNGREEAQKSQKNRKKENVSESRP